MDNIDIAVKVQLLNQEIATYENTRYILGIRYRVNKKIGNTAEQLKPLEDELVKIEQALEELKAIRAELAPEKAGANGKAPA